MQQPAPASTIAITEAGSPTRGPVSLLARDIKLAHSVFALPFAVLAAFIARDASAGWARFSQQLALVVVCMVSARTWAMLVNRLADAKIDAMNARTARRVIASGEVSPRVGWAAASVSAGVFVLACLGFYLLFANPWPVALCVPVLAWLAMYSWTKRFTWMCHLILGASLAASPLAAAIAVEPAALGLPTLAVVEHGPVADAELRPAVFWLAAMVVAWVAGFDVIYALQDTEFDRRAGLRSIPASLGVKVAVWVSRGLHVFAAAALVMVWRNEHRFGIGFAAAAVAVGMLLVMEHVVLARRGKDGLHMAFFVINGVVSCVVGAVGVWALLVE